MACCIVVRSFGARYCRESPRGCFDQLVTSGSIRKCSLTTTTKTKTKCRTCNVTCIQLVSLITIESVIILIYNSIHYSTTYYIQVTQWLICIKLIMHRIYNVCILYVFNVYFSSYIVIYNKILIRSNLKIMINVITKIC